MQRHKQRVHQAVALFVENCRFWLGLDFQYWNHLR